MKKLILITSLSLIVLMGACNRFGAMKGPITDGEVNPDFVEFITDRAEDKLDLSDSQTKQLEAIVNKMAAKAAQQRPAADALRAQMADEVRKPTLDAEKVQSLVKERMELYRAILETSREDLIAFHATLSAEQRDKLASFIEDHGKKGWHGRR